MTIVKELRKVIGHDPKKVFIEMARGGEEVKKRKVERKVMLQNRYRHCADVTREFVQTLEDTDNQRLRQDKLFLYYTQMGRDMYSGEPIELSAMLSNESLYDIDHIYPQSRIKDDSIDNRVLVKRKDNMDKRNDYPLSGEIREKQRGFWEKLLKNNLISRRKFERLTRTTPFTDEELSGFIARQLVETRQGTKAVAQLLQKVMPETEVVYVKASLASEFRHKRDMLKVRELNDLHHAKDAYLNIVIGNLYHVKFTKSPLHFIRENRNNYTVKMDALLEQRVKRGGVTAWEPGEAGSIRTVRAMMQKNSVLVTVMPYVASGALFDLQPKKMGKGQVPLKKDLPIARYGGYNKPQTACFMLVEHVEKKDRTRSLIEVPMHVFNQMGRDACAAVTYCEEQLGMKDVRIILPRVKMRSLLCIDGFRMILAGKTGERLDMLNANQLYVNKDIERYIQRVVSISQKADEYEKLSRGETYILGEKSEISKEENEALYRFFLEKLSTKPYCIRLSAQIKSLNDAREKFASLDAMNQVRVLRQILKLFTRADRSADLSGIGLGKQVGTIRPAQKLSGCEQALLIHQSPTGLFEQVVDLLTV